MTEAQLILVKRASGHIRMRVRLCDQVTPAPPSGGALSIKRNLQISEETGEVTYLTPVLRPQAKTAIKEYACAIEREYGRDHCIFLTGTLPGSTDEALREIAKCQKLIQRRLRQWLADVSASSVAAVFVWEFQKRGALHLHVLVGHGDSRKLRVIRRGFRQYWIGLLKRLSARNGVDMFARRDGGSHRMTPHAVRAWAQTVRKTVSSYLAKYLSKSYTVSFPHGAEFISRLWGATSTCRGLLRQFSESKVTVPLALHVAEAIYANVKSILSVAAAPTFEWTRIGSPSETAMVACLSADTQEPLWQELTNGLRCNWLSGVIDLPTQSTENNRQPCSPADVCFLFAGRMIGNDSTA